MIIVRVLFVGRCCLGLIEAFYNDGAQVLINGWGDLDVGDFDPNVIVFDGDGYFGDVDEFMRLFPGRVFVGFSSSFFGESGFVFDVNVSFRGDGELVVVKNRWGGSGCFGSRGVVTAIMDCCEVVK